VVVRTRNRPYFLERAVRDLLAQSFGDWRLVVANDGGDLDEVHRVLAPFGDELGDRLVVLDVPRPGGRCAAANEGIRATAAPYVVLHDDDDRWDPSFLATTVDWLDTHPGDVGVMVPTEIVYEKERNGRFVETGRGPFWAGMTQITFFDLLTGNRAVPISFLYRRSVHDEVGFYDETLDAVEDWEFYLRVTAEHHIGFIPGRNLAFWTQRPAARGDAGNSMFALGDIHERSTTLVRDRAVRAFVRQYGPGMPLLVAGLFENARLEQERRLRRRPLEWLGRRILSVIRGR
jgi:glycosyltransferase involved in cell wall biosynthesis